MDALRSGMARGALHQSYLFGGPEGVGKGKAARLLAQAANCVGAGGATLSDPCGTCAPCQKIARGTHPDVIELAEERVMVKAGRWEPKSGRTPSKEIVVDQVRDLVDRRLSMRRFEGRRRFVLIDPADAMNPQAQNALLKTLEEPPEDTTLVLVAASPDALLPTIRSRCVRIAFGPLPDSILVERLEDEGRSPPEARLVAALAGGSLGRALALDAKALEARQEAVSGVARLDPDDASTWIAFARDRAKDREAARGVCQLLEVWLRDVLAVQAAGPDAPLALADLHEETKSVGAATSPAEILRRIDYTRGALAAVDQNGAPVLAMERMLIGWFHGDR